MRWRLSVKLALWLAVGLALVFGMVSYWGRRVYRSTLEEVSTAAAERMGDVIKRATRHSMLQNNRADLYFTIRTMGAQPGIKRIRIYNQEGRISFSTDPAEVNHLVDKTAEACYGCHAQSAPLTKLARPDRVRFFQDPRDGRVLGLIHPIENDSECSNSACHAHPASQRVLGVLDTQLSMISADAHVAAYAHREFLLDLLGMAALLLLCIVLVWMLVQKPVRALMEGTRRFGAGELAYRISVRSSDEIGTLAESFNRMGTELQAAREELSRFAQTLEQHVQEKTAQVQQAMTRMAEMERLVSLGKLAAAVAHEINNPLAGVLTYAKLLGRHMDRERARRAAALAGASSWVAAPEETAEQREWLAIIEGETRRCGALVKNLLTFARQVPIEMVETDINGLLERCLRLVQHQLELQNIQWEWNPDGPLSVYCDSGRVQQVFLAIIVNAVDAMPRGGLLRLDSRLEPAGALPERVVIEIADNGAGIAPDVLPHIFEPFFTTKDEARSTGMGLAVAYGIIRQHGGEIRVESQLGQGTAFRIYLPVEARPPAPEA
jgi:two-component system NtrC family sensor kinase